MRYVFLICVICGLICVICVTGCETPEGGSSLPWSQPEPWETQVVPNIEEQ